MKNKFIEFRSFPKTLLGASIVLGLSSGIFSACSKSSDSSSGTNAVLTELMKAFPTDLAVSSPTAQKTAALQIQPLSTVHRLAVTADSTAEDKATAINQVLSGTTAADCVINVNTMNAGRANCYGPNVSYTGHPDGSPTSGNLPGGDTGLWSSSESPSGESCASAELNQQMKGVSSQVDAGLFAMAGMICSAQVSGAVLPDVGSSLDLATALAGKVTINSTAITLTTASLSREADTTEGYPVYVSIIEGDGYYIRLKHIATTTDNSTFKGKLSIATPNHDKTSISYIKESATSVTYELKSANGNSSAWESVTDFTAKVSTGWQNNANYLLANYDPSTGSGTFQYAWQAGAGDSHARVFNATISGTGSSQTGIAYFGFGPNMASGSGLGSITGMICNWAGPSNSHTPVTKVQKQTIALSGTMFTASTSAITYDPVNTCDSNSGTFSFTGPAGSAITADTTTSDLVNVSEIATNITTPTAPSNVDL